MSQLINDIRNSHIVNTKTQQEYDRLMEYLDERGYRWYSLRRPSSENYFTNGDFCVRIPFEPSDKLNLASAVFYEEHGAKILSVDEYMSKRMYGMPRYKEFVGSTVVNTKTQDEHDKLMKHLSAQGYIHIDIRWRDKYSCIRIPPPEDTEKRLNYANTEFYRKECGCEILGLDEYMISIGKPIKNLNRQVIQALQGLQLGKG